MDEISKQTVLTEWHKVNDATRDKQTDRWTDGQTRYERYYPC